MRFFRHARGPAAWMAVALCIVPPTKATAAAMGEPAAAEFAIRWNTRDGGPVSAEATLDALALRAKHESHFEVGYYDLPATLAAPRGFSSILRWRAGTDNRVELTFKQRGDRALAQWSCPMHDAEAPKAEVDVTFGTAGVPARTYSYSCTRTGTGRAEAELSATRKACTASVMRQEGGPLKIEEWRLPGNVLMIEVSSRGANSDKALEKFRARVVTPLLGAGITPAADSKTALGSRCP